MLCVLFGLALLAGGLVNFVYAAENRDLHRDACLLRESEICNDDLERVVDTETALGVS